jgi:hypothetical protein
MSYKPQSPVFDTNTCLQSVTAPIRFDFSIFPFIYTKTCCQYIFLQWHFQAIGAVASCSLL